MRFFSSKSAVMNEMVFENKNKDYGAYLLRKNYPRTIVKAFLWSLLVFLMIFMPPLAMSLLNENASYEEIVEVDMTRLMEPPAFEPSLPPMQEIKSPDQLTVPKIIKKAPEVKKTLVEKSIENPAKKLAELLSKTETDSILPGDSLSEEKVVNDEKTMLKIAVDAVPSFPGGQEALYLFLQKNMVYPPLAKKSGIAGTVIVSFMIEANGRHNNAKILSGIGAGCDDEVLRVISLMPNWNPGQRRGANIPFLYNLPVQFALK